MSLERVFIFGSLVNLRDAASPQASVVKQLPLGTECVVEEKANSGWWRIGCGETRGWAKAELLSAERPTLEPLLATAQDSKQPLKDRFDAALRATALAPEHVEARSLLWNLFAEQEWVQLENLLTQQTDRSSQIHVSVACAGESPAEDCLISAFQSNWRSSDLKWYLRSHHSERLAKSLFVLAVLDRPFAKDKPLQLWVRTGTFAGDAKALDIQVFAESRYVPSDALKSALERLPEAHGYAQKLSKLDVVLSSKEQEALRPLLGGWNQVFRKSGSFSFWTNCHAESGVHFNIQWVEGRLRVIQSTQEDVHYDVGGVQLAKDGSITLKMMTGQSLKHVRLRDDKRVSSLTGLEDGLFVHEELRDAFPVEEPAPGECDQ